MTAPTLSKVATRRDIDEILLVAQRLEDALLQSTTLIERFVDEVKIVGFEKLPWFTTGDGWKQLIAVNDIASELLRDRHGTVTPLRSQRLPSS